MLAASWSRGICSYRGVIVVLNPEYANSINCPRCGTRNRQDSQFCGHCGKQLGAPACSTCGHQNSIQDEYCTSCGSALSPNQPSVSVNVQQPVAPVNNWGYGCAIGALFIFPPLLGFIAFIIGIVNLSRGHVGPGIAQMILAVICGLIGMAIGVAALL